MDSGIRDTSRVLGINKKAVLNTFIKTLKKKGNGLVQVNPNIQKMKLGTGTIIHEGPVCQEVEIDEQYLNFRTWIKRLARKAICFSKLKKMHDIAIGLLINKIEFGIDIHAI